LSAINTTTSRAIIGRPPSPAATCGSISTMAAFWRPIVLITSDCDPLRTTTTLEGEPVSTNVFCRPAAIISTAANTNTTSAMPATVRIVVSRLRRRLRML